HLVRAKLSRLVGSGASPVPGLGASRGARPHGLHVRNWAEKVGLLVRPLVRGLARREMVCHPAGLQRVRRMTNMRYEAPNSLDQAVALLAHEPGEARVLAGGTDLLVQMRTDLVDPILVVDIKGIAELRQITEEAGGFRVGAAVTGAELTEHPKLKSVWPGIVE